MSSHTARARADRQAANIEPSSWTDVLNRMRYGAGTVADAAAMNSRLLQSSDSASDGDDDPAVQNDNEEINEDEQQDEADTDADAAEEAEMAEDDEDEYAAEGAEMAEDDEYEGDDEEELR